MEEIKNKNNETKNESELIETTNPYILELCNAQGNKKIVPVLPVANFTELLSNILANLDNTCMSSRVLFDQLDPSWALKRPVGYHPITEEKYNKLKFENKQILTFFGYPSDFFVHIEKDIEDLYGDVTKFIEKNGSGKIRILNSFFFGKGDDDLAGVDVKLENSLIFNFVKDTAYEIKDKNDVKSRMHRDVLITYMNGTKKIFYLPTFIDEKEIPIFDKDKKEYVFKNKVFWENMNQILKQPIYKNSQPSDFDFIEKLINYDEFFTVKEKGDDITEYFAIVKKQESCKSAKSLEKNLCKGARDLIDNILKSEECKSLIEKGFEISKSSIYDALMEISTLGCETTLAYPKIVPKELQPNLNLDERIKSARKDFLDGIKEQIAKKHKVRICKQKNEIWDWEDKLVDSRDIYSITNYWQAVISSVFLKFRDLDSQKRQLIFYNFVNCYESMKSENQDMKNYFSKNLDSNFGYKTPILIKKLMEKTGLDLSLNEKDLSDLAKSISHIFEILTFADHATQIIFFEKLESKDEFNDLFLIHNNKLIVQIPELVKLLLEKYNLPPKYYKYNCLVDTELIHSDSSSKRLTNSCEVSKISEFKFHYDGLPYIFGISRESLETFINNFADVENYGFFKITGKFKVDINKKKYYSRLGSFTSKFGVKEYINSIICSLSEIDIDRLYHLCSILPENFWSKSSFIDYYFLEKNGFDMSDLEKIVSIIKIADHISNYGLLDKVFEFLLTSKNISCSLILDMVRIIFDSYSQRVFDYKKMINENDKNHNNIESVLRYKTHGCFKELLGSGNIVKIIKVTLDGYLLEIHKQLNKNSTSKISLFIEKSSNYMYDCESFEPVKIVFDGDKLSLNKVDKPIKLDTSAIPGLENSFKLAFIKLEMNYYKVLLIKFLKKALSNYNGDIFEQIYNLLIEKNKNEHDVFDVFKSMISKNAFSAQEHANLFKYFSLKSEKFILENLDYCFVKLYIGKIFERETIEKIILETQKFPNKTAKKQLKKLIKFNPKFLDVLREMEIYKSAKESYDFKKIIEESKERKEKVVAADYSNNYHKDLFGDTCTDSDELSENEKNENTKHNIKEENNCSEQKKSIRSYIYNIIYKSGKPENDESNRCNTNSKEEI